MGIVPHCLWLICAKGLFPLPPDAFGEAGEPLRQNVAKIQEYGVRGCDAAVQPEKRYPKGFGRIGHAMLFWGFSLFLLSYIIFIGLAGGFGLASVLTGNTFERVFSSILDFAGLFVLIAIVWAAIRRYIVRPARLEMSAEAGIIMIMVFALMLLHFGVDGFGLAASGVTTNWPPIGGAIAQVTIGYQHLYQHADNGLPQFMVGALCPDFRLYGLYSPLQAYAHSGLYLQYHVHPIRTESGA